MTITITMIMCNVPAFGGPRMDTTKDESVSCWLKLETLKERTIHGYSVRRYSELVSRAFVWQLLVGTRMLMATEEYHFLWFKEHVIR
jgi:hypothetical protein